MVNLASLQERFELINNLYSEHLAQTLEVQADAIATLVPQLAQELDISNASERSAALLDDPVTIFRFLRKAHFDPLLAGELLRKTLTWRLTSSLDLISPSSLDPFYTETPLMYVHPSFSDKFGRPAAVINLKHVIRTEDGSLDSLKEYIAFNLEVTRRYLAELSMRSTKSQSHIQIVFLLDLAGANLSNLEIELLPFTVDLLKNHFPGMVAAVYVLNYGWTYASMWAISRRLLPRVALERILFPSGQELLQYFDKDSLLAEHGGTVDYHYRLANNHILLKYGRPSYYLRHHMPASSLAPSPAASRPLSRVTSSESLQDTFYSMPNTPRLSFSKSPKSSTPSLPGHSKAGAGNRHPSWLDMTSTNNSRSRTASRSDSMVSSPEISMHPLPNLPQVRSVGDFRQAVQASNENSLDTFYDDASDGDSDPDDAGAHWDAESDGSETDIDALDVTSPNDNLKHVTIVDMQDTVSRQDRLSQLRTQLQRNQPAPTYRPGQISGHVSPYNSNNPFYGYPATRYVASPESTGGLKLPHPRPYHSRRRKRDLLRTLSYLAALRILALHRTIKWRLALFWQLIWNKLFRWGAVSSASRRASQDVTDAIRSSDVVGASRKARKGVRWAPDRASRISAPVVLSHRFGVALFRRMPKWIIMLAALIFFRSRFFGLQADKARRYVMLQLQVKLMPLSRRVIQSQKVWMGPG